MEYKEYFSNLYEKYKDTSKDAVEDIKHFKYDFYNLVLDSLQIKEDYEKHFTSDHILSDDDISFLEEFTSFIMNDSSKKDSNSKAMARGVGKKKDRNNGRQIINRNFDPYSEILLSIFTKFNKTISKDINNSFCLENNPIVQIIFKKITKDRIKQISDSLVKRIDSLPAPFFSCFFSKLSPDISKMVRSCMKILDKFEEYNNILFIGGSNNNDIITKAQNITANTLIKPLSEESRDYYYDIKHKEQSAPYRQTKRELEKLKTSLNHTIFNDNKDLFNQLKLQESDFQYKEKITTDLETQNALAEEIYAAITYDMEDLLIKFKK